MGRNFSKYDNVTNEMQFIIIHLKNNTVSSFNSVFFSLSLSLTISLSLSIFTLPASCEAQWTSFGSSCYKLYKSPQKWKNAKLNCQKFGSKLVKIESDKESKFLKRKYSGKRGRYWIGLSDFS